MTKWVRKILGLRSSIRRELLVALLLTAIFPLVIAALLHSHFTSRELISQQRASMNEVAVELASKIANRMRTTEKTLQVLTTDWRLVGSNVNLEQRVRRMKEVQAIYPEFSDLLLYNRYGEVVATTGLSNWGSIDADLRMKRALNGEVLISPPHRVLGGDGLYMTGYVPVIADGVGDMVLAVRMRFNPIGDAFAKESENGTSLLLDRHANILHGVEEERLLTKYKPAYGAFDWKQVQDGAFHFDRKHPESCLVTVLPQALTGVEQEWLLVRMRPTAPVVASLSRTQARDLSVLFMALVAVVGCSLFISRSISTPVEEASRVAKQAATGELGITVPVHGPEELKGLARAFNTMLVEVNRSRTSLEDEVAKRTRSLEESQNHLEQLSAQLMCIYHAIDAGFLLLDREEEKVQSVNQAFCRMFGVDNDTMISASAPEVWIWIASHFADPDHFIEDWGRTAQSGVNIKREWPGFDGNRILTGQVVPVPDGTGREVSDLWIFEDITDQRRLEEELNSNQKMDAIGKLAGGIAHDFNNVLTVIIGHSQLLQDSMADEDELRADVQEIIQAAERAEQLTSQLLAIGRKQMMPSTPLNINSIIMELTPMLKRAIGPGIGFILDLHPYACVVTANKSQFEQIILNLVVNARDAMPDGGKISLTTRVVERSDLPDNLKAGVGSGPHVMMECEDTGMGMDEETQKLMFEPFFTTKEQDQGTGLGLASVWSIVEQFSGLIQVESQLGRGSRFVILIPECPDTVSVEGAERPVVAREKLITGSGTIMVVDDEPSVLALVTRELEMLGYEVLACDSGGEALEYLKSEPEQVDLILTDIMMPGMSGFELAERIESILPACPIIFMSGFSKVSLRKNKAVTPNNFIKKPFRHREISVLLQKHLSGTPEAG